LKPGVPVVALREPDANQDIIVGTRMGEMDVDFAEIEVSERRKKV
jgi:hypothetical protein